jgi:hypothetical protein
MRGGEGASYPFQVSLRICVGSLLKTFPFHRSPTVGVWRRLLLTYPSTNVTSTPFNSSSPIDPPTPYVEPEASAPFSIDYNSSIGRGSHAWAQSSECATGILKSGAVFPNTYEEVPKIKYLGWPAFDVWTTLFAPKPLLDHISPNLNLNPYHNWWSANCLSQLAAACEVDTMEVLKRV